MNHVATTFTLAILVVATSCSGDGALPSACLSMFPAGTAPVAPADVLAQAMSDCNGDTGACTGNPPCGPSSNRVCDASKLMTADAAVCFARAAGLGAGLQAPTAGLVYDFKARRIAWGVSNVLFDHPAQADGSGGDSGGQFFQIDAIDGAVLSSGQWSRIP
jgi:hypothetical protein